uniref:Uncharacterized protein n=1 Tax=Acrobeloides nanus TaxID=290746 RepID=A0A914DYB4_9BILA
MGRVKSDHNLTSYTKQGVESRLAQQYASWWGNQSEAMIKIFEDAYSNSSTADDDHLAWLQFAVNVNTPAYFTKGSLKDVQYYLLNGNPNVFTYEFAWSSFLNDDDNPIPNWKRKYLS